MTTNGALAPLNAFTTIDASLACRMKGNLCVELQFWGGAVYIMTYNDIICGECKFKSDKFKTFEFEVSSLADQKQAVWFLFDGKNVKFKSFGFVR